jgi:hypothetical protein
LLSTILKRTRLWKKKHILGLMLFSSGVKEKKYTNHKDYVILCNFSNPKKKPFIRMGFEPTTSFTLGNPTISAIKSAGSDVIQVNDIY